MISFTPFDKPKIRVRDGISNRVPVKHIHVQVSPAMVYIVESWDTARIITEIWTNKTLDRFDKARYTDSYFRYR